MTISRLPDGRYKADLRPNGTEGKRYRKIFEKRREAERWEAWIKTNKTVTPGWEPLKKDSRRLSELIETWHQVRGKHLKDGRNRRLMLNNLCNRLGNPLARNVTAAMFAAYRQSRLDHVTANTINHEHTYLSAVFTELERIGEWTLPNELRKLRKLPIDDRELHWLTREEISELLDELKSAKSLSAYHIARICLASGARWTEAETVTGSSFQASTIRFRNTKNGKHRSVPITESFRSSLPIHPGRLFKHAYPTFKRRAKNLSFTLPTGQLTHVLRHTFASHFIMNGGNILVLQKILGHGSLDMTIRYAHLAPDHLEQAKDLNPLTNMDL
jgi:integrase